MFFMYSQIVGYVSRKIPLYSQDSHATSRRHFPTSADSFLELSSTSSQSLGCAPSIRPKATGGEKNSLSNFSMTSSDEALWYYDIPEETSIYETMSPTSCLSASTRLLASNRQLCDFHNNFSAYRVTINYSGNHHWPRLMKETKKCALQQLIALKKKLSRSQKENSCMKVVIICLLEEEGFIVRRKKSCLNT
jgi:hypothetical protein